jgi:hypothetical protein
MDMVDFPLGKVMEHTNMALEKPRSLPLSAHCLAERPPMLELGRKPGAM